MFSGAYELVEVEATFDEARFGCENTGRQLIKINSAQKHDEVMNYLLALLVSSLYMFTFMGPILIY